VAQFFLTHSVYGALKA